MPIIKIENIGKKYRIAHAQQGVGRYVAMRDVIADLSGRLIRRVAHPFSQRPGPGPSQEDFWALKGVTFDINRGDRIGIIGRNGAGKSTLLKILSRITEPTEGRVTMRGRVASLLEVGTGFHPELTGRENIYLNGAILGMSRREIDRKFDEIVDFAGVEKFLEVPVKRFSSGMYVRLAFAVAAHLESEILLVDEVLAVGDSEFQKKCLGKMDDISKNSGKTVLFVSHNMGALSSLCNRGVVLKDGGMYFNGTAEESIASYLSLLQGCGADKDLSKVKRPVIYSDDARIVGFDLRNETTEKGVLNGDRPCRAEILFEVLKDDISVGAEFLISDGIQRMCLFHSDINDGLVPVFKKGLHKLVCHIDSLPLYSGTYYVSVTLSRPGIPIDHIDNAVSVDVMLPHRETSMYDLKKVPGSANFYIKHRWGVE